MRERSKKSASQEVNQSPREDPNLEPQKQTGKQKECQVSVRENRCSVREKDGSVRDQIRQVVSDLEQVLGGLKQVHVEMKEVVHQIDHLTSNIDLGEVEGTSTASPPGGMSVLNPRDGRGVLVYNQNTSPGDLVLHLKAPEGHTPGPHGRAQNHTVARHSPPDPRGVPGVLKNSQKHDGGQGTQSTDPDQTVTIETTSPSLVLTASVIKTNRVIAATPRDPKPDRYGPNGHGPLSGPNREMNHGMHHLMMPSTQLSLLPLTPDLTSDLTSDPAPDLTDLSSRREKPPAYLHHNGQMERISKGLAPPTYPAHPALPVLPHLAQPPYPTHPNHPTPKTPPHLGKGRTGSSMV
ncbi:hypothetical protein DPEC_G00058910 [Dallia pectoralis]|uniref:Uncharacterized protein n=1 Tax=Dallia pectoralis TaxID=75939 RepID=A0ACC2H6A7_DALPE|nr:hypothetical protein DPEC_G00058910 [Dallia pectoralis]